MEPGVYFFVAQLYCGYSDALTAEPHVNMIYLLAVAKHYKYNTAVNKSRDRNDDIISI